MHAIFHRSATWYLLSSIYVVQHSSSASCLHREHCFKFISGGLRTFKPVFVLWCFFEILLYYNSIAKFRRYLLTIIIFNIFVDTSPNNHHIISVDTYYDLLHLWSLDMNHIYALYNPLLDMSYSLFIQIRSWSKL